MPPTTVQTFTVVIFIQLVLRLNALLLFLFSEDQLKDCRIEVSKYPNKFNTFADITTALKPGETKRFSKNPGVTGSIVRIRNVDRTRRALTLCEVKVYVKETGMILVISVRCM